MTRRAVTAAVIVRVAALVLALVAPVRATAPSPIELYVSPTGNDADDGTFARPFRTIERAQQQVRTLKASAAAASAPAAPPPVPINVFLRGGRYELQSTLEFSPLDSGDSPSAPVTYQPYCDASVAQAQAISVLPFPYSSYRPPAALRPLWNGVGDRTKWPGPVDPFLLMDINRSSNAVLQPPFQPPAPLPPTDVGDVCVDKVGVGHTCYADGSISAGAGGVGMATCVSGCMTACAEHIARPKHSDALVQRFRHLFGKDLTREEDCVERCSLSCRVGCERATISGAKRIAPGALTTWALHRTLTTANGSTLFVLTADLTPHLPPGAAAADTPTIFTTLYANGALLPRAGFPDCQPTPRPPPKAQLSAWRCAYATPLSFPKPNVVRFDAASFSSRVGSWSATSLANAELELRPRVSPSPASADNAIYRLTAVDVAKSELTLGAGGSQVTPELFARGLNDRDVPPRSAAFRVENVLEELDAHGEWFFDPQTKQLFLIPPAPAATAAAAIAQLEALELELPLLHQLVRVSGSRENQYTQAARASSTLVETDSTAFAGSLVFRSLVFSGTQLLPSDVYERVPSPLSALGPASPPWTTARVAAVFLETVRDVTVELCAFDRIGGNALMVSGASQRVRLTNNNVSFVGSSGIVLLARAVEPRDPYRAGAASLTVAVAPRLLVSRDAVVAFNQVHHIGRRVARSAAVAAIGAVRSTIDGNLIYGLPVDSAVGYLVSNADGAAATRATALATSVPPSTLSAASSVGPLIRAINAISIAETLAQDLSIAYEMAVPLGGFDIPIVAKLIGAPTCPTGSGRDGALYAEQQPVSKMYDWGASCSGCCSLHANSAQLRVDRGPQSVDWGVATSREVIVRPGESITLRANASSLFNALVDVYVGFHVVTPNGIHELPTRARWRIRTRRCRYAEDTYRAQCFGPCRGPNAMGCGNSNAGIQQVPPGRALQCRAGYEADRTTHVCEGPFEALADCDGSGVAKSQLYYNCSIACFTTSCV
ncbi:hypothetical protein ATCC90586_000931 [Pythium insidiosum]|nr:hypothetical protein ATCC90586_000931 [Pythium insidiosum]